MAPLEATRRHVATALLWLLLNMLCWLIIQTGSSQDPVGVRARACIFLVPGFLPLLLIPEVLSGHCHCHCHKCSALQNHPNSHEN